MTYVWPPLTIYRLYCFQDPLHCYLIWRCTPCQPASSSACLPSCSPSAAPQSSRTCRATARMAGWTGQPWPRAPPWAASTWATWPSPGWTPSSTAGHLKSPTSPPPSGWPASTGEAVGRNWRVRESGLVFAVRAPPRPWGPSSTSTPASGAPVGSGGWPAATWQWRAPGSGSRG